MATTRRQSVGTNGKRSTVLRQASTSNDDNVEAKKAARKQSTKTASTRRKSTTSKTKTAAKTTRKTKSTVKSVTKASAAKTSTKSSNRKAKATSSVTTTSRGSKRKTLEEVAVSAVSSNPPAKVAKTTRTRKTRKSASEPTPELVASSASSTSSGKRTTRRSKAAQDEVSLVSNPLVDAASPSPVKSTTPSKGTPKAEAKKTGGASPAKSPKGKSPRKRKLQEPIVLDPPKGWESIYTLVEELRSDRSAPVDSDGSEALPQTDLGDETYRFQVLIALMLSSQTKDAIVGETMRKLQKHGLTVSNIQETSPTVLDELIFRVGFHNTKTKNILKVVDILQEEYQGDIPPTAEKMMELPGIGPKMAYIIENVAWGKVTGIGIDTHMHRIFNQLGWVKSNQPEQTRRQLEAWLPREHWGTVNLLWVGFGQEVQQFQPKLLRKVLDSSRPYEGLKLVKKLGLDYRKVGKAVDCMDEIDVVLKGYSE